MIGMLYHTIVSFSDCNIERSDGLVQQQTVLPALLTTTLTQVMGIGVSSVTVTDWVLPVLQVPSFVSVNHQRLLTSVKLILAGEEMVQT